MNPFEIEQDKSNAFDIVDLAQQDGYDVDRIAPDLYVFTYVYVDNDMSTRFGEETLVLNDFWHVFDEARRRDLKNEITIRGIDLIFNRRVAALVAIITARIDE
jgi:hypothetical protein